MGPHATREKTLEVCGERDFSASSVGDLLDSSARIARADRTETEAWISGVFARDAEPKTLKVREKSGVFRSGCVVQNSKRVGDSGAGRCGFP